MTDQETALAAYWRKLAVIVKQELERHTPDGTLEEAFDAVFERVTSGVPEDIADPGPSAEEVAFRIGAAWGGYCVQRGIKLGLVVPEKKKN